MLKTGYGNAGVLAGDGRGLPDDAGVVAVYQPQPGLLQGRRGHHGGGRGADREAHPGVVPCISMIP